MTIFDPDLQAGIEMRRQRLIENAVRAADEIILEGSDGSVEETNYLTHEVAMRFVEKAASSSRAAMLKRDIGV